MGILAPYQNIKQFIKRKPKVHPRVLLMFWYMKAQLNYIKKNHPCIQVTDYIWPLFESKDDSGPFSIVLIPAPGMPVMDMIVQELLALGAEKFLLFGTVALLGKKLPWDSLIITNTAFCAMENRLARQGELAPVQTIPSPESNERLIFMQNLLNEGNNKGRFLYRPVWCTLFPYLFDKKEYQLARKQGCAAMDMESFALFSNIQKTEKSDKNAVALFYPRDRIWEDGWQTIIETSPHESAGVRPVRAQKINFQEERKEKKEAKKPFLNKMIKDLFTILRYL